MNFKRIARKVKDELKRVSKSHNRALQIGIAALLLSVLGGAKATAKDYKPVMNGTRKEVPVQSEPLEIKKSAAAKAEEYKNIRHWLSKVYETIEDLKTRRNSLKMRLLTKIMRKTISKDGIKDGVKEIEDTLRAEAAGWRMLQTVSDQTLKYARTNKDSLGDEEVEAVEAIHAAMAREIKRVTTEILPREHETAQSYLFHAK
ncbi:hypothetical protein HN592_01515 [Candidatus Woesearchaeota archaeon]|jgi:hypothetical protein|nr:hypothetical protein [Candidatus Woesearchaeota archaeon]MBT4368635.1 hypothetical protein [Candidatus Woesearchaeota archaeon]MBT4713056.1 hypothetical protein [Candidatus Woesearchaeota archaeon]MBT6638978.1 hypothetical protein [Candidatus Woesearchaeota archaeon]MBT7134177.1 hypothetical protein [Candidatus Woesearchaeota archaeon]